jgi:biotin carboxyl carrier protein
MTEQSTGKNAYSTRAMTFDVQVDDLLTKLEVHREGDEYRFRLGSGEEKTAHMIQVEPGVFSLLAGGRSYEACAETGEECAWITIQGHRFRVVITDPRRWSPKRAGAHGQDRENIIAPMPGKIVRVLVAPGERVESGQGIVVVEAMKMQNEMKAHRGGRIAALPVHEGETVPAGAILATIE